MTNSNKDRIKVTLKELTYITEMTLIVGLFMAAIRSEEHTSELQSH